MPSHQQVPKDRLSQPEQIHLEELHCQPLQYQAVDMVITPPLSGTIIVSA